MNEQPGDNERVRKKTFIPAELDLVQLEDFIDQLYPRVHHLSRVGFTFMNGRVDEVPAPDYTSTGVERLMWGDCDRAVYKGLQFHNILTVNGRGDRHKNVAVPAALHIPRCSNCSCSSCSSCVICRSVGLSVGLSHK